MNNRFYTPSEAGRIATLGRSTIMRAIEDGDLPASKTPRGHWRIPSEALDAFLRNRNGSSPTSPDSPLEYKKQELAAKKLRLEEAGVDDALREIRDQKRERAREKRLAREKREEELRLRRLEQENEKRRIEAKSRRELREQAARIEEDNFHRLWSEKVARALSSAPSVWDVARCQERNSVLAARREILGSEDIDWLSPSQRKALSDALHAEVGRHTSAEGWLVPNSLLLAAQDLLAPWRQTHSFVLMLNGEVDAALKTLPYGATDSEKTRAKGLVREALKAVPQGASRDEVQGCLDRALCRFREAVESRIESEEARNRKDGLVRYGTRWVHVTLAGLYRAGDTDEDFSRDADVLEDAELDVRRHLQRELTGREAESEVREIVHDFLLDWV